tara:strand:- start:445 stop:624 length:180 start_codon:yes stop_codon:yes gene_type:complete
MSVSKEKSKQYNQTYYNKHKDKIIEKKMVCECGGIISGNHAWRHRKTKKHRRYEEKIKS